MYPDSLICPVCQRDDLIQKVTAIVSSGTFTGSFIGPTSSIGQTGDTLSTGFGITSVSGSTQSNLAKQLASPPKPKENRYDQNCMSALFWFGAIFGGLILGVVLFGAVIGELGGLVVGTLISCIIAFVNFYNSKKY